MDGDPTPALTGRRRTRPTSIGCRKPRQPKPGRAPLIAAHAAVQTNRATSLRGEGLITLRNGSVTVLDWERLRQAGEFDPTYLHLRNDAASPELTLESLRR